MQPASMSLASSSLTLKVFANPPKRLKYYKSWKLGWCTLLYAQCKKRRLNTARKAKRGPVEFPPNCRYLSGCHNIAAQTSHSMMKKCERIIRAATRKSRFSENVCTFSSIRLFPSAHSSMYRCVKKTLPLSRESIRDSDEPEWFFSPQCCRLLDGGHGFRGKNAIFQFSCSVCPRIFWSNSIQWIVDKCVLYGLYCFQ